MKWFRWYHGTVDDRKWLVISRRSGQDRAVVIAVWCALLEFASQAEERGCVRDFDCESLDALLDARDGACASVLAALVEKGLVRDGRLSAWDKRQPRREDEGAAERQRRRRQRLALPPAGAVPPAGDAGGEGAFPCVDAEIIPPENSTDYDERHAASRVVAGGYAPEEEEEKIFQLSPPSPPSAGRGGAVSDSSALPLVVPAVRRREEAPPSGASGDMGFQQLVDAYPRDHVAPRAEALAVWQTLGRQNARPGLPRLLQALELWRDSPQWRKEDGRYIPKLANFLRRRMWEDSPGAPGEEWEVAEARQRAYRARMNALLQEASHG